MSEPGGFFTYTRDEFVYEFVHPDDRVAVQEARDKRALKVRAEYLTEMRKKAGLTQTEVAEAMGISQQRVSAIENGTVAVLVLCKSVCFSFGSFDAGEDLVLAHPRPTHAHRKVADAAAMLGDQHIDDTRGRAHGEPLGRQRAEIAQAQDRRAVGDHRHAIAPRGVVIGGIGIGGDGAHGNRDARGIGKRKVALCRHRLGGADFELAGLVSGVKRQGFFVGE